MLVTNSELKDEGVFVAHRDIQLSKEWRDEIVSHLDSCTHLIAMHRKLQMLCVGKPRGRIRNDERRCKNNTALHGRC